MNTQLHRFFTDDHHRIEALLDKATPSPGEIEMEAYAQFRSGLMRHIKMEERILFPAAQEINKEKMAELMPRFRREHGALTALVVPPPTEQIVNAIRYVLEKHDWAEEKPGGMYDICEELTQSRTQALIDELSNTPQVPLRPNNPKPVALEAAKRALQRAGYDYDEIS